jgi:mannose-6-phosphate isomerase-like protein (cupin superfamily)
MTFTHILRSSVLLAVFLIAGCGGSNKGMIPRDYKDHDQFVKMDPQIYTDNEVGWTRVDDNTSRKVYFNDRLTLELVKSQKAELKKDIRTEHGYHDRIGYVVKGGAIVTVARSTRQIGPGGAFVVPSNVPFDVIPASDNTVVLYVYTPPRDDLRPGKALGLNFNENDIRSFVYRWFGLLDERADVVELMTRLSPDKLRMEFADKKVVTSPEAFRKVYTTWTDGFVTSVHKVEQLNVELDPAKGQYRVRVVFSWERTTADGMPPRQARYQSDWVLTDFWAVDAPRITSYVEQELKKK